jgi:membrane protease YdiL (CAAX protease family)
LTIIITILLIGIITVPNLGVLIAVFFVLIALFIGKKKNSFRSIGFIKQKRWQNTIIRGMLLGVVIQLFFSIIFDPFIEKLTGIPIDLSNFDNMRGNLALFFIWLGIGIGFGGFLEEITFRGYLITRLELIIGDSPFSLIIILLITSVSFGLAHLYQDWSGVISTGIFAFIFGVIFIQSKYNLWMPILTHSFANVVGLVLIYTNYDRVLNGLLF